MKVEVKDKPVQVVLTIQNEQDRRLLYGFLMLDINLTPMFLDDSYDPSVIKPDNVMANECITELAKVIADDSTFDGSDNAD